LRHTPSTPLLRQPGLELSVSNYQQPRVV
jgi:hypothetical protein